MINPMLWHRDVEIMMEGNKYVMDSDFWANVVGNPTNEKVLLKAFYTHAEEGMLDNKEKSESLMAVLKQYKCSEILRIIEDGFTPYEIDKKDISQFSDFKDAYYFVPMKLKGCGIKNVDYSKMGYLLQKEKRKDVADKKYGENHMKTCAQLGLCHFEKCKANPNALGNIFIKLTERERADILPKLCLYIPYVQNYFMGGATDDVRDSILSILSKTTQIRRRSNVNTIIKTVKDAMEYEL